MNFEPTFGETIKKLREDKKLLNYLSKKFPAILMLMIKN
jgi:hypothetical protein